VIREIDPQPLSADAIVFANLAFGNACFRPFTTEVVRPKQAWQAQSSCHNSLVALSGLILLILYRGSTI